MTSCLMMEHKNNNMNNNKNRWKVLFFGTDEFALESLKCLHKEYKSMRLLERLETVTAYNGHENNVLKYAKDQQIKIHSWPLDKNIIIDFDIGIVVSFGHLIPSWMIQSFPLGMINVHASLLPKWRGAAPIIHSLMNGDNETGVTIMKIMPKKFDVGEILDQQKVIISPDETHPELYSRLANTGGQLLIKSIEKLPNLIYSGRKQCDTQATYAPKINKNISFVRWTEMTAQQVYNLQRSLIGIYPLTTVFNNQIVKIFGIKIHNDSPSCNENLEASSPGAIIYDCKNNVLLVKCHDNKWVSIEEITIPNHRKMNANDFNNGFLKSNNNNNNQNNKF
ncbi:methionyl-tRNA formyltransferase, mitochondrial, partial [Aphidius gifuensis]|uniref:methionyl-tRNA formyltransferase, mitochondrial n=1 Tax=Aphidius gifuensis TaxID=684658 RepID=UPI001CDB8979